MVANAVVEQDITYVGNTATTNPNYCCGSCNIQWADVQVAYWPAEDADTSCLSDLGATDGDGWFKDMGTGIEPVAFSSTTSGDLVVSSVGVTAAARLAVRQNSALSGNSSESGPKTAVGKDGFT